MKSALLLSAALVFSTLFSFAQAPSPAANAAASPAAHQRPAPFTPEERQTLNAAQKKAQDDPDVKAAMAKRADAQKALQATPEQKALDQATADYNDALHKAMIAADPSVADLIARMPQPGMHHAASAKAAKTPKTAKQAASTAPTATP